MTTYNHIIIAGQDVADRIAALKAKTVLPSLKRPGCFDSESLCAHQRAVSSAGYIEAQIVESNYGFGLRYASGLQDFGLIYSARDLGGSLEAAITAAQKWQAADPERRWVTRTVAAE
jgi:hypothetical protein